MEGTVLVADDDRAIRTVLTQALSRAGAKVHATSSLTMLMRWVEEGRGDVVITDVMMPDGNGIELVPAIRERRPDMPVIVISARNTVMTALEAAEVQAWEYLPKPFDLPKLLATVARALEASDAARRRPRAAPEEPRQTGSPSPAAPAAPADSPPAATAPAPEAPREAAAMPSSPRDTLSPSAPRFEESRIESDRIPLVGTAPAMQAVFRTLSRLIPGDEPVLIIGESGTGKTRVAHVLHDFGPRGSRTLVTADAETLAGPGAVDQLLGRARGGTILVEEVASFTPEEQRRLLALLERAEGEGVRVLATSVAPLDVLAAPREEGGIRPDLFYRLAAATLSLPPLRERLSDIPALVADFFARNRARLHPVEGVDAEGLTLLQRHAWPGNLRQLENVLRRAALMASVVTLGAEEIHDALAAEPAAEGGGRRVVSRSLGEAVREHLRDELGRHAPGLPPAGLYGRVMAEVERPLITLALEATGHNQLKAAALLGINRNTLRRKLDDLGIPR